MLRRSIPAALALCLAGPLAAADFTVTLTDDPAPNGCTARHCSLREAVIAANASPGRDRVLLGRNTYNLTRLANGVSNDETVGALWVRDDTDFVGQGYFFGQTHVRWSEAVVADAAVFFAYRASPLDVSWSQMKVSHGVGSSGGCFYLASSSSVYTLSSVIVHDCRATSQGGALTLSSSTLSLLNTTIERNSTNFDGGGLYLASNATLISVGSRIRSNSAGRDGGGLAFAQIALAAAASAFWQDDGTSSVTSNSAVRDGGGLAIAGDVLLDFDGSEIDPLRRLSFGKNTAGRAGGGISRAKRFVTVGETVGLNLRQVSIAHNNAPRGGGLDAAERVQIEDVEFKSNSTAQGPTFGNGGGLHLNVTDRESRIVRSSFTSNQTGTLNGGAIYSIGCAALVLENVSIQNNTATRAAAIGSYGDVTLRHTTVNGNTSTTAALFQYNVPGGCGTRSTTIANSLIADTCSTRHVSAGGNQFGPEATGCTATASDQRQSSDAVFGLSEGTFGGAFLVTGWNSDGTTRPQRDYGLAANCSAEDVRGLARADGFCDAGAFEQQ